nr:hypothetical protein CFP56_59653 [Quercus suber]
MNGDEIRGSARNSTNRIEDAGRNYNRNSGWSRTRLVTCISVTGYAYLRNATIPERRLHTIPPGHHNHQHYSSVLSCLDSVRLRNIVRAAQTGQRIRLVLSATALGTSVGDADCGPAFRKKTVSNVGPGSDDDQTIAERKSGLFERNTAK